MLILTLSPSDGLSLHRGADRASLRPLGGPSGHPGQPAIPPPGGPVSLSLLGPRSFVVDGPGLQVRPWRRHHHGPVQWTVTLAESEVAEVRHSGGRLKVGAVWRPEGLRVRIDDPGRDFEVWKQRARQGGKAGQVRRADGVSAGC